MAKSNTLLRREVDHTFRVGLDPKHREPLVKELIQEMHKSDELKKEAANVAATFRKQGKELKDKIDELVLSLEQGKNETHRCEEIKDFKKGEVKYVRLDTRETVTKRAMTDEDQQLEAGQEPADEDGGGTEGAKADW